MAEHVIITCIVPMRPNRDSLQSVPQFEVQRKLLERTMAHALGGYTVTKGRGAWVSDEGVTVDEKVHVYTIDVTLSGELETASIVAGLRYIICTGLDQQTAFVSVQDARYESSIGRGNQESYVALCERLEAKELEHAREGTLRNAV